MGDSEYKKVTSEYTVVPLSPHKNECSVVPSHTANLNRTRGPVAGNLQQKETATNNFCQKYTCSFSDIPRVFLRTPPEAKGDRGWGGAAGKLISSRFGCRSAFLVGNCTNVGFYAECTSFCFYTKLSRLCTQPPWHPPRELLRRVPFYLPKPLLRMGHTSLT